MTSILQPLDVYWFARFKAFVRARLQRIRAEAGVMEIDVEMLVVSVCAAVRSLLHCRSWAFAFERLGFGTNQANVSKRVLACLGLDAAPVVTSGKPSAAQLQLCFPGGARLHPARVWEPGAVLPKAGGAVAAKACAKAVAAPCVAGPPAARPMTRAHAKVLAAAKAKSESPVGVILGVRKRPASVA